MKLFIRTVRSAILFILLPSTILAQSMLIGPFPGASEYLLGSRFRNVRNVNFSQVQGNFTGIPDLGSNRSGVTRKDAVVNYGADGIFNFTITYDVAANTLTTTLTNTAGQTFVNTLDNITSRLSNDGKLSNPVNINLMRLTVRTQTGNSSIVVSNLAIDGFPIQSTYGRINNNGMSEWHIISNHLSNGFVVTGTVTASGNFSNSAEAQRVEFGFGYAPVPNASLPVTWGEVKGRATAHGNLITWTTLQEINTSHFDIQRSTDGIRFYNVGSVAAAGESSHKITYQFEDRTSPTGTTTFYRLLQVDKDGSHSYSTIIKIQAGEVNAVTRVVVMGSNLQLRFHTVADRTFAIMDMNGRVVRQMRSADPVVNVNVSELAGGMYVVAVNTPGKEREIYRFVK